jgi:hypothetical protein
MQVIIIIYLAVFPKQIKHVHDAYHAAGHQGGGVANRFKCHLLTFLRFVA